MSKRCKKCGKLGHNSRTCGRKLIKKEKTRKPTVCSICGLEGHNSRTCTKVSVVTIEKKEVKSTRICSKCGKPGHNARTCHKQQIEEGISEIKNVKTHFKDEDDFLKCVLNLEYKDIKEPHLTPQCIPSVYLRENNLDTVKRIDGYHFLVNEDKFVDIYVRDKRRYIVRRGRLGGETTIRCFYTKDVGSDILKRMRRYKKKYTVLYG